MTNGGPLPQSGAPYIIICSYRIAALNSKNSGDKIKAASDAAAELTSFYAVKGVHVEYADTHAISVLQHEMMDEFNKMSKREAEAKVEEMFALLDALEQEYGSGDSYD